jgi:hypothetical protein
LHELPDDIVNEIADFTAFVLTRRKIASPYFEWSNSQWQALSLSQFLRDADDDVEYSLNDAEEAYQP